MFMLRLISKSMDKSHDHTRVFIDNFFNTIRRDIMTLSLVYRLNGLIGLIWAASMWLTPEMMADQFQFESSPDMVTMG